MKKKITYRDQLFELARIYSVKEIQDYVRKGKNLTSGQLELILKKNKIIIPKEYKTNFFKENISKPISRATKRIDLLKEDSFRSVNKISRKISYFKEDSKRSTSRFFFNLWNSAGKTGLAFLNFIPVLGKTFISSIGKLLTNLFNEIYNQKISSGKATRVIVSSLLLLGVVTIVYSGVSTLKDFDKVVKQPTVK